MLYGITDIGSNTIRFKIYDYSNNSVKPIITKKKTAGLISFRENNKLNSEGISILLSTLKKFKTQMKLLNVDKTFYFATASLRNIDNSEDVLNIVKLALDIDIKILSSKQEADYSFSSVKHDELNQDEGVLVDVGGGSSEITVFKNRSPIEETSLPIGSLSMYDKYVSLMYPSKDEIEKIRNKTLTEIKKSGLKQQENEYLFAVGGTIRTINKLLQHLKLNNNTNIIPIELFDTLLKELSNNTKEDYQKILQVKADRIHTLIPGIIIIQTIAQYFNIKKIFASKDSLREGILYSIIENGEIE